MYQAMNENDFMKDNQGMLVTVPELSSREMYILKPGTDKKYYSSYEAYFQNIKMQVIGDYFNVTLQNVFVFDRILEAGLWGNKVEFLRSMEELSKIK